MLCHECANYCNDESRVDCPSCGTEFDIGKPAVSTELFVETMRNQLLMWLESHPKMSKQRAAKITTAVGRAIAEALQSLS